MHTYIPIWLNFTVPCIINDDEQRMPAGLNRSGWTPWKLRNSEKDGLDHSDNIWLFLKYIVKSFGIRLVWLSITFCRSGCSWLFNSQQSSCILPLALPTPLCIFKDLLYEIHKALSESRQGRDIIVSNIRISSWGSSMLSSAIIGNNKIYEYLLHEK